MIYSGNGAYTTSCGVAERKLSKTPSGQVLSDREDELALG
jgi:hypothetical protein